jgi:hypothetical protein
MNKKRMLRNLLIYLALLLGGLFLYYPFRNDPANVAKSAIKFIYAQF